MVLGSTWGEGLLLAAGGGTDFFSPFVRNKSSSDIGDGDAKRSSLSLSTVFFAGPETGILVVVGLEEEEKRSSSDSSSSGAEGCGGLTTSSFLGATFGEDLGEGLGGWSTLGSGGFFGTDCVNRSSSSSDKSKRAFCFFLSALGGGADFFGLPEKRSSSLLPSASPANMSFFLALGDSLGTFDEYFDDDFSGAFGELLVGEVGPSTSTPPNMDTPPTGFFFLYIGINETDTPSPPPRWKLDQQSPWLPSVHIAQSTPNTHICTPCWRYYGPHGVQLWTFHY